MVPREGLFFKQNPYGFSPEDLQERKNPPEMFASPSRRFLER